MIDAAVNLSFSTAWRLIIGKEAMDQALTWWIILANNNDNASERRENPKGNSSSWPRHTIDYEEDELAWRLFPSLSLATHDNDYWIHDHMLVPEVNAWSSVNHNIGEN